MTIAADTHIILNVHSPKKDAVIGQGSPVVGADEVVIWANGISAPEFTAQTIATWWSLFNVAMANIKDHTTGALIVSGPIDGSDSSVVSLAPVAGNIGLYVSNTIASEGASHFIDRTLKRLCERWLELAKTGSGVAPVARARIAQAPGDNSWDFSGAFWSGDDVSINLQIIDPDGLEENDNMVISLPPLPGGGTIYNPEAVAELSCRAIADLVHYRCARTGTRIDIGPAAPANSVVSLLQAILS